MKNFEGSLRLCIHTKDIVLITGYSEGYSRKIIRLIREKHNKQKQQAVTISEFCDFMGLRQEDVSKRIY